MFKDLADSCAVFDQLVCPVCANAQGMPHMRVAPVPISAECRKCADCAAARQGIDTRLLWEQEGQLQTEPPAFRAIRGCVRPIAHATADLVDLVAGL